MFFNVNVVNKMIRKSDITMHETDEKNDSFILFSALSALFITFISLSHLYVTLTDYDLKKFI